MRNCFVNENKHRRRYGSQQKEENYFESGHNPQFAHHENNIIQNIATAL